MPTNIKCPNCSFEFPLEDALNDELKDSIEKEKQQLRQQMQDYKRTKEEELRRKEDDFNKQKQLQEDTYQKKLSDELKKRNQQLEESIRKSVSTDYENQLKMLQQSDADKEEKLKEARKKELDFLQKEKALNNKEAELELQVQRQLMEGREKMKEQLIKEEQEKMGLKEQEYQLRMREMEKQLEDQKKMVSELKRIQEQGSMQLQGEVLELALEELLKSEFQYDDIVEVKKGEEGGDVTHTVYNDFRQPCGNIVWESKRTKAWSDKWIEKLKIDMRNGKADLAVIVTQVLPKNIDKFGRKDGIWICTFSDVRIVATILRDSLIKIHESNKLFDNVSDKKEQLYKYMTGNEFKQKWEAIIGTYINMQKQLAKEKIRVTKDWSERDKQLDIMLKNAMGFIGDVKGIGGLEIQDIKLLDDAED